MARRVVRLTDQEVKKAKVKGKEYTLSDGDGLQLRIRPNGTKSWQFKYSHPISSKPSKVSLGTYPSLSLLNARTLATEYRSIIAQGDDPKVHIQNKKMVQLRQQASTLVAVAELWHDRKKIKVTTLHAEREWRTLEKYIFPDFGNYPIEGINRIEIIEHLRKIESTGKLSTLKRICQSLNQIMDYAVDCAYITSNPFARLIKVFAKHEVQHMPTLQPVELAEFMRRLHHSPTLRVKTRALILWQFHTMTRPKEAVRTRWADIDIENKCWTIPATEMKNNKNHRIPLTDASIRILQEMKIISGNSEFLFPGDRNTHSHASVYTANAAIKRTLNYKGQLVAHGLRAIASTTLHEEGFDSLHIEACLSHSDQNETRASYNRTDFFENRKTIMSWWSKHIEEASKGLNSIAGLKCIKLLRIKSGENDD